MKVALIQQYCHETAELNLARSITAIEQAAHLGAKLVVLPELHLSPYFCKSENANYFKLAQSIPGATTATLSACAKQHEIVLVSSLFERRTAGIYHNTAVVFEQDGSIVGMYRKMHIPDDPGYYEKYYFTPGDLGFQPIKTSVGKLGILICWDQWYPEAARLMTLAGADLLIYPTAIGWEPTDTETEKAMQLDSWITIQRSHGIANGLHVLSCNRIGTESDAGVIIDFWGNSFISGPQGEILQQESATKEAICLAEIDLNQTETVRQQWPFLRDRRIESFSGLTERYLEKTSQ